MAEFKTIDAAAFEAAADRGRKAYATPRAISARFDKRAHRVVVILDTGIDFAFDPARAPELRDAAPEDLVGVTVEGVGGTIRFPRLDADFTVSRILEGFLGPMSPQIRLPCLPGLPYFRILSRIAKLEICMPMEPTRVTSSDFQQAFGFLSDKARSEPVVITKHGRDSLVVLPIEEWRRLQRNDRRVGATVDLAPEWIEAVRDAEVPVEFASLDADLR